MKKMNRVVIFSSARSGGNLLDGMFNQYKSVRSFGELFSRRNHNHKSDFLNELEELYSIPNKRIIEVLEDIYSDKYDTWVCRHHEAHYRYSFNQTIYEDIKDFKKVLLYRENFVNKLFSLSVASYIGDWHYTDDEVPPNYNDFNLYYNPEILAKFFNSTRDYYNDMLERYEDVKIIRYEDLIQWENLDHIMRELDIEVSEKSDEINTKHINKSDDSYKQVINYDQVKEYKLLLKNENGKYKFR